MPLVWALSLLVFASVLSGAPHVPLRSIHTESLSPLTDPAMQRL